MRPADNLTLHIDMGQRPISLSLLPGQGNQMFRPDRKKTLRSGPPAPAFIKPDDTRTCLLDFKRNGFRLQSKPLAEFTVNTQG